MIYQRFKPAFELPQLMGRKERLACVYIVKVSFTAEYRSEKVSSFFYNFTGISDIFGAIWWKMNFLIATLRLRLIKNNLDRV